MGFYSPSQLVQDARRHGIEVRPVDLHHSHWNATLETSDGPQPAVRLGFNLVRGLSQEVAWRIEEARAVQAFGNLRDAALRAQLSRQDLQSLAHANALLQVAGHRGQALWQAIASAPDKDILRHAAIQEKVLEFDRPTEGENIARDYHALGLSLERHPLALLRPLLQKKRFLPSDVLNTFANGQFARGCGIVTVRQRPPTAKGVMFLTLEDEAGQINVIVRPALIEKQRKELLSSTLLGVYGIWQTESNVHHLVAKRLVDLSHLMGQLQIGSRDFA
jgi:error-prone DNA polymerase